VSNLVWIPTEQCVGVVESQMMYGAIVKYSKGGFEYHEMLADDDYETLYSLDEVMEEFNE
jgi:hypothetical protein